MYVDNDPIVLVHARALLVGSPQGATAYVDADVRDTGTIMAEAARVLDFTQPVAVMLLGVLHCLADEDDPAGVVARLMAEVVPGSYLVVTHPAADVGGGALGESMRRYNEQSPVRLTARTHAQVSGFFAGLDMVEPGLVQLHRWRPGTADVASGRELANYGGVGRKR